MTGTADPTPPDPYKPFADARVDALTTKLAAAERHTQEVIADCDEYQRTVAALRKHADEMLKALEATEAKLAAAEAVIGAAEAWWDSFYDVVGHDHQAAALINALATYRAKETEA